ncbi:MAG: PqiC family protein [Dinoroseobacter sp.]|nr:PqiC family protein [Dinoroseobacter sp.]
MIDTHRRSFVLSLLAGAAVMAGCSQTPSPRYPLNPVGGTGTKSRVSARTVEMRRVSLPAYAAGPSIVAGGPTGALVPTAGEWADDPDRAITAALAAGVEARSTARTSTEPWPLSEPPDARVEVRFDQLVARTDGVFVLLGQIAVSSPNGQVRDNLRRVSLNVPITGTDPQAIAAAQTSALGLLADEIVAALR